mmetsp:Transcript_15569/g.35889  ORF Transcript_15569/g.35889 Transcript_15569/m.35889 type:complete len:129 (-) Transcript_15569:86-472(-)
MIPPCAHHELQSWGTPPANRRVTGIRYVSAATRAAALPATPEPTTNSRSFFSCVSLLGLIAVVPNPRRRLLLPIHLPFDEYNDEGALRRQRDRSPICLKARIVVILRYWIYDFYSYRLLCNGRFLGTN